MSTTEGNLLEKFQQIYEKQEHKRLVSFAREARIPLLIFAICMAAGVYFFYRSIILVIASDNQNPNLSQSISPAPNELLKKSTKKIYIDLSGAVIRAQTYEVDQGTRLFRLIELAGGLSPEADKSYIQRNYNFSVILTDQQKIHIPSVYEVRDGYFTEKRRLVNLDTSTPRAEQSASSNTDESLISINDSSLETLKILVGVGDVTAQRIIAGRPYTQVRDLLDRGIIKQSLYDNIVNNIEL
jgi:DNA uptake protein ComE-like DNA-binding protein